MHRRSLDLDRVFTDAPSPFLLSQVGQCGAVTVVGLGRSSSCTQAAALFEGANTRTDNAKRCITVRTHDPCDAPVVWIATIGTSSACRRAHVIKPDRSTGTDRASVSNAAGGRTSMSERGRRRTVSTMSVSASRCLKAPAC